jgi:hypothetical protein
MSGILLFQINSMWRKAFATYTKRIRNSKKVVEGTLLINHSRRNIQELFCKESKSYEKYSTSST